jgi:hypothetical protein
MNVRQGVLPESISKSFQSPSAWWKLVPRDPGDTDTSLAGKTFVTGGLYLYREKLGWEALENQGRGAGRESC